MTDRYAPYLQDFDVFDGKPPEYHARDFSRILKEARRRLRRRQPQAVYQAVLELDRAIEYVSREDERALMQQGYQATRDADYSYEHRLHEVFRRRYLPAADATEPFTPSEYGAALAIAVVASTRPELHVRKLLREMIATDRTQRERDYQTFSGKQLSLARNALGIGQSATVPEKRGKRVRPDDRAIKDRLRADFIRFYLSGDFASRSEAARRFHRRQSRTKRDLVGTTDRQIVRFYTGALRRYLAENDRR